MNFELTNLPRVWGAALRRAARDWRLRLAAALALARFGWRVRVPPGVPLSWAPRFVRNQA